VTSEALENVIEDVIDENVGTAGAAIIVDKELAALSVIVISLLKNIIYREDDLNFWSDLQKLQIRVRDYVFVLGLELIVDESEGYAYLQSRTDLDDIEIEKVLRLVPRRRLSFPVSLLLALLRKKLAEFDSSGSETRLILSRDEIVEMMRLFLPDSNNEIKLHKNIDTYLNKVIDLGFLYRLKTRSASRRDDGFEVRRILKAFVDAQWLSEFDAQLATYRMHLLEGKVEDDGE